MAIWATLLLAAGRGQYNEVLTRKGHGMLLTSSSELTLFADTLGVPRRLSVPFARKVECMYRCSGKLWTVKYLKTVYLDYVRFLADLPPVGTWYRKGEDGIPAGVFRPLFLLSKQHQESRFGVTQLLRCFTAVVSPELLPEQWEKFISGVSAEPVDFPKAIGEMLTRACDKLKLKLSYGPPKPYYAYTPSSSRYVPDPSGESKPEEEYWINQHRFSKTVLGQSLLYQFQPLFSVVLPHDLDHQIDKRFPNVVGKIGMIQEPGMKLRAVANPNRVFQHALQPLGSALYDILRTLPWDCTHQQEKAVPVVQASLKQHKRVFCVDLTGATDYFPLSLQELVLKHIVQNDTLGQLQLFLKLSRSPWLSSQGVVEWTKGQPLGLYPSFASFALTHGLVLFSLNGCRHDEKFFILGDDVVILDEGLHSKYRRFLANVGCPIAESKSLSSTEMAEFGGKLVTSESVISQLKWRQVSDDNFVDVVRNLGIRAKRLLRTDQRGIVDLIAGIPDFLGGLGFNPKGIPLKDRIELYYSLIQPDRSSYLLSLSERVSKYFNTQGRPPVLWTDRFLRDFDQKSALHVLSLLRFSEDWVPVLGCNLRTVAPNLGLPMHGSVRRTTLLQRLTKQLTG